MKKNNGVFIIFKINVHFSIEIESKYIYISLILRLVHRILLNIFFFFKLINKKYLKNTVSIYP